MFVFVLNQSCARVLIHSKTVSEGSCYDQPLPASISSSQAVVPDIICPGPDRRVSRHCSWLLESRLREKLKTSRRRLYQPGEDDYRADHLLYGRSRYRLDVGCEKTWPDRNQG